MAHFAQVNEQNIVQEVIVVSNDDCGGGEFPESEPIGQAFIASIGLSGTWLQTSYHGNFRNVYAGISFVFDPTVGEYGAFIPPYDGN
jgi:hypothetical protein